MTTIPHLRPIPQPQPKFVLGNMIDVGATMQMQNLIDLAHEYGAIYQLQLPDAPMTVLSSVALANEACDDTRFDKFLPPSQQKLREVAGDGLFTAWTEEPNWGKAHRVLLPNFSLQSMQSFVPMMQDLAEQLLEKWERLNPDDEIDVVGDMTRLTMDTIGLCGFDYRFNSFYRQEPHPFVQHLSDALGTVFELQNATLSPSMAAAKQQQFQEDADFINALIDKIIADRQQKIQGGSTKNDLLQAMMTGEDRRTGERLSEQNMRYQIITFLVAGHETTSSLLSWAIYFLLKHPDALARATAEADRVLGRDPRLEPTFKQIHQLDYTEQVLKETLRLVPPLPGFSRYPYEDTTIGQEFEVKKGEHLRVFTALLHRDPAVWGQDVESFNPDRFTREAEDQRPPNAWKPFGTGERGCIGRQFAMQEAALVLGQILQRFRLIDHTNYQVKLQTVGTLKPVGFKIKVEPRPVVRAPVAPAAPPQTATAPLAAPAPAIPAHNTPLLVLYGSNMGTSEALAHRIGDDGEAKGCVATVAPLDHYVGKLPTQGAVVIVTSSYNGTPPDNAVQFCQWLQRGQLAPNALQGVNYMVFGCGNREWAGTFQSVPRQIDRQLEEHGARRIYPRGEGDASEDFADQFEDWYRPMWRSTAQALGIDIAQTAPQPQQVLYQVEVVTEHAKHPLAGLFGARLMEVVENRELHTKDGLSPSERSTRHMEVALPAGTSYLPGDHLGVLPANREALVNRVTERFGIDPDAIIRLHTNAKSTTILPLNTPLRIFDLLSAYVELQDVATRKQIGVLAEHTPCPPDQAKLAALVSDNDPNHTRYKEEILAKRRSLLDILEEIPSCELPFELYLSMLARLGPRYYSISSSPLVEAIRCSITVGVVDAPARKGHGTYYGVCSVYLANQPKGSAIYAFVKDTKSTFRLPADVRTPIIMVGPGTGVAPFRGFLQERAVLKARGEPVGPSLLFFGCRQPQQDFIYADELRDYARQGVTELHTAFSRVPGQPKAYVQHSILEQQGRIWELLQQGAVVYICGEGNQMAPAVQQTFQQIYQQQTGQDQAATDRWMAEMMTQNRYLVDVWASS